MTDRGRRIALAAGLAATLALLLAHVRVYAFLCDDAFISFRYARNLADGFGLVFNPGFERVEGYTNFLWTVLLAGFARAGLAPETVANPILIACTVGLWALVARFAWSSTAEGESRWPALVPPLLLACTRSVAVWSTSGLETRMFELLVVAATLRLAAELESTLGGGPRRAPIASLLFALATLTRPDALLMSAAALSAAEVLLWRRGRFTLRRAVASAGVYWAIVGAHFLWRHAYYGAWLPNTYYAKVGGRAWWEMGLTYLGGFALEYGALLWIPLILLGALLRIRRGSPQVPLLFAAVVVPHAVYIASIGGDHFEYRPFDLYFPFAFLLVGDGVRFLAARARSRGRALALAAYAGALALGVTWIPWQSHRQFVNEYVAGFPGLRDSAGPWSRFLDPSRDPLLRWPGLRSLAGAHRDALRETTGRFVGVRAEEHRLFRGTVEDQARKIATLVGAGSIPRDAHFAMSCVGVIPYRTNLRTLDRLGLTDAAVARSAPNPLRIMAHDKHATLEYAASMGVDFWSEHPVHSVLALDDPAIGYLLKSADAAGEEVFFAETGDGGILLGRFPLGAELGRARFPKLRFESSQDPGARRSLDDRMAVAVRARLAARPDSLEARLADAADLARQGRRDEAIAAYRALDDGTSIDAAFSLGTLLGEAGRFEEAVAALRRSVAIQPDFAEAHYNLAMALAKLARFDEAAAAAAEAVRLDPEHVDARYLLGIVALSTGRRSAAEEQARFLESLGTPRSVELAGRLRRAM